jgi:hypothetical protein
MKVCFRTALAERTRCWNVERQEDILGRILKNTYAIKDGITIAILSFKIMV